MVCKFSKNLESGVTLIEIIVVLFIIALFTVILITDFPKILRQYALSRVTYKLGQDLRRTEDLGLSGIKLLDKNGTPILVKGYGIYFNNNISQTKYLIYADVAGAADTTTGIGLSNQKYDGDFDTTDYCEAVDQTASLRTTDCIIDIIDLTKENQSLSVALSDGFDDNYTSINFSPPAPVTTIDNLTAGYSTIEIDLQNTDGATRAVFVNTSGLIDVQ